MKTEAKGKGSKRGRAKALPQPSDDEDAEEAEEKKEVSPRPKQRRKIAAQPAASSASAAAAASASAAAAAPAMKQDEDDDADDDGEDAAPEASPEASDAGEGEEKDVEALAASLGLSVYEYNRQQNIRLKNEQLSLLNLSGMASDIGLKRAAPARAASGKKKRERAAPVEGVRRSLRSSVRDPNYVPPPEIYIPEFTSTPAWQRPERKDGPIPFEEALADKEMEQPEKDEMAAVLAQLKSAMTLSDSGALALAEKGANGYGVPRAITQASMPMLGEGPKIIKARATVLSFHPAASLGSTRSILAVGDKNGFVSVASFANDAPVAKWIDTVQVAQYAPHVGSVVELQWGSPSERHALYTASRDGSVRRMDLQASVFEELWTEDPEEGSALSAMTVSPDRHTLYVGDRAGVLHVVDTRAGSAASSAVTRKAKSSRADTHQMQLSQNAINSLSINPLDKHMLASAGKDRTVRVWDLRKVVADKPLASWEHAYSVNSVEFSPSGRMMASTSYDDTVKLFSCVSASGELLSPSRWAAPHILRHNNHTGRWVTVFKAKFAPRDAALAIGNMDRPIDVFNLPAPAGAAAAAAANGRGASAAAAAAASASSASAAESSVGFSKSGSCLPAPVPAPVIFLKHPEFVTSIPAAVAWNPSRVQVAGCTSSGRLYVYGRG